MFRHSRNIDDVYSPFIYDENGFDYITWGLEHINYRWDEIVKIEVYAKRFIFMSSTLVIHFERKGHKFRLKISDGAGGFDSLLRHLKKRFPDIKNELNIYIKPLLFGGSRQVIYER